MIEKEVFISKGVLANICATGCAEEVFASLPYRCALVDSTVTSFSALWEISLDGETMIDCQEMVSALIRKSLLHLYVFERARYFPLHVALGRSMREELADLFTLAAIHDAAVALDDTVIRKRVGYLLPDLSIQSTLSLFYQWQTTAQLATDAIQSAFQQVVRCAHFQPPEDDPLYSWWMQFFSHRSTFSKGQHLLSPPT